MGPMKRMPASSQARANAGFSESKIHSQRVDGVHTFFAGQRHNAGDIEVGLDRAFPGAHEIGLVSFEPVKAGEPVFLQNKWLPYAGRCSFAAQKEMRIAISLRFAASNFLIVIFFGISGFQVNERYIVSKPGLRGNCPVGRSLWRANSAPVVPSNAVQLLKSGRILPLGGLRRFGACYGRLMSVD